MFNKCLIQKWEISHIAGTSEFDITLCQLDCANGAYLYFESRSYKQAPFISKIQVSKLKDIHQ